MKVYSFDASAGRAIDHFGSSGAIQSWILRLQGSARVSCFHLAPGGVVGYHPAASEQLLLVVQGEGQVRGESGQSQPIRTGQAAFWKAGEWHETSTQAGLTAIVIEGDDLNPGRYMSVVL